MSRTQKNKATEYHLGLLRVSCEAALASVPARPPTCLQVLQACACIRQLPEPHRTPPLAALCVCLQAKLAKLRTQLQEGTAKVRGGGRRCCWQEAVPPG